MTTFLSAEWLFFTVLLTSFSCDISCEWSNMHACCYGIFNLKIYTSKFLFWCIFRQKFNSLCPSNMLLFTRKPIFDIWPLTTHINIDLFRTTKFGSLGVGYELIRLLVEIMARLTGSLRPQYTIIHLRFMPTHTIFMEGCLNEQYWGVDWLNKDFKGIKNTVFWCLQNGDAEATNNFQRNKNDGYAFVTLSMMHGT